jgi:hypothetical protein
MFLIVKLEVNANKDQKEYSYIKNNETSQSIPPHIEAAKPEFHHILDDVFGFNVDVHLLVRRVFGILYAKEFSRWYGPRYN